MIGLIKRLVFGKPTPQKQEETKAVAAEPKTGVESPYLLSFNASSRCGYDPAWGGCDVCTGGMGRCIDGPNFLPKYPPKKG